MGTKLVEVNERVGKQRYTFFLVELIGVGPCRFFAYTEKKMLITHFALGGQNKLPGQPP